MTDPRPASRARRRRLRMSARATAALSGLAALAGCTTTAGDAESTVPVDYTTAMDAVCVSTKARLDALPIPPEGISLADWATEVSFALRDEAAALDAIAPDDAVRVDHRSLVANTEQQAAQWLLVAAAVDGEPDRIGELRDEIAVLSLGRDDLATDLGIVACRRDVTGDATGDVD